MDVGWLRTGQVYDPGSPFIVRDRLRQEPGHSPSAEVKTQFTFELLNILKSVSNTQLETKERNSEYHKEQTLLVSSVIFLI